MNFKQAEEIYRHPKGHTKTELHECLDIMNSHYVVSPKMEAVIQDAKNRLDKLNGVIDVEFKALDTYKLIETRNNQ